LGTFRKAFGTFEKPLMNGFVGGDFVFFRPKLGGDIDFGVIFVTQNKLKIRNSFFFTTELFLAGHLHTLSNSHIHT
jgi:hypothetical protein